MSQTVGDFASNKLPWIMEYQPKFIPWFMAMHYSQSLPLFVTYTNFLVILHIRGCCIEISVKIRYSINYLYRHWVTVLLLIGRKYRCYILWYSITSFAVSFERLKCYIIISWIDISGYCKKKNNILRWRFHTKKVRNQKSIFSPLLSPRFFTVPTFTLK